MCAVALTAANSENDVAGAAGFTSSALAGSAPWSEDGFHAWLRGRYEANRFEITRIPLAEMDGWGFESGSGNLVHESGRFFSVEGLRVDDGPTSWTQPILNQPEIGILGILAKEFDGVLHFLMQAKMEPGNINTLQLSPTVQATRSNYMRVHRGKDTRYLEYFRGARRGEVLVDVLQSEQGAWFLRKRNRNIVVRVDDDVPEHEDFHWLTLRQMRKLLTVENLVGMDCRTVLACMPFARPDAPRMDAFTDALVSSYDPGARTWHTTGGILSWLTEIKSVCDWRVASIPLAEVAHWSRSADEIADDAGRSFSIIGVRVAAGNREVSSWAQPLLAPRRQGMAAFVARPIDGVLHLLVHARRQPGLRDIVEMGPTVHLLPDEEPDATAGFALAAMSDAARVRFDAVLSEEGGRFFHAETRYQVIEAGSDLPLEVPPNFCWVTVRQLMDLVAHSHYLNVEARTLLACLHSLW
jgi:oxidase EvaA